MLRESDMDDFIEKYELDCVCKLDSDGFLCKPVLEEIEYSQPSSDGIIPLKLESGEAGMSNMIYENVLQQGQNDVNLYGHGTKTANSPDLQDIEPLNANSLSQPEMKDNSLNILKVNIMETTNLPLSKIRSDGKSKSPFSDRKTNLKNGSIGRNLVRTQTLKSMTEKAKGQNVILTGCQNSKSHNCIKVLTPCIASAPNISGHMSACPSVIGPREDDRIACKMSKKYGKIEPTICDYICPPKNRTGTLPIMCQRQLASDFYCAPIIATVNRNPNLIETCTNALPLSPVSFKCDRRNSKQPCNRCKQKEC